MHIRQVPYIPYRHCSIIVTKKYIFDSDNKFKYGLRCTLIKYCKQYNRILHYNQSTPRHINQNNMHNYISEQNIVKKINFFAENYFANMHPNLQVIFSVS